MSTPSQDLEKAGVKEMEQEYTKLVNARMKFWSYGWHECCAWDYVGCRVTRTLLFPIWSHRQLVSWKDATIFVKLTGSLVED